jgi:hypothetical protein
MEEEDDEGEKTNALATDDDDIAIPPRLGAAMAASRSDVRRIARILSRVTKWLDEVMTRTSSRS